MNIFIDMPDYVIARDFLSIDNPEKQQWTINLKTLEFYVNRIREKKFKSKAHMIVDIKNRLKFDEYGIKFERELFERL